MDPCLRQDEGLPDRRRGLLPRRRAHEVIAKHTHTKIGVAEQRVGMLKVTMSSTATECSPDIPTSQILTQAVEAMNDLGPYRGHIPYESMLGRTPEMDTTSIMSDGESLPLLRKLAEGDESDPLERNTWNRVTARPQFLEVDAGQKMTRLLRSRSRLVTSYYVCDVLLYWRRVKPGKNNKNLDRPGSR